MTLGELIARVSGIVTGAFGIVFMICGIAVAGYAYYSKMLNGERAKAIAYFALAAVLFAFGWVAMR